MKKIIALALATLLAFSLTSTAFAEEQPKVITLDFSDATFQQEHAITPFGVFNNFSYEEDGIEVSSVCSSLQYVEDYLLLGGADKSFTIKGPNKKIVDTTIYLKNIELSSDYIYYGFEKTTTLVGGALPSSSQSKDNNFSIDCDGVDVSLVNDVYLEYFKNIDGYESLKMQSSSGAQDVCITKIEIKYFDGEEDTTTETSSDTTTPDATTTTVATAATTTSPQTGDQTNAGVWIALGAVAVIGLTTVIVVTKKQKR